MNAKKCDKCGNYFDKNTISYKGRFNIAGITFIDEDKWKETSSTIDLCDNCIKGLLTYLNHPEVK